MKNRKLKNTIVLRGMASNIVEEAIVILKPNIKIKQKEYIDKNNNLKEHKNNSNYIIKEAENVILEYVNKIEEKSYSNIKNKKLKKYKFLQILNIILIISNILILIIK